MVNLLWFNECIFLIEMNMKNITPPVAQKGMVHWMDCGLMLQSELCLCTCCLQGAKYLSGISMEIYLCHMMLFRVASMLHLDKFIHNNDILYVVTCIATLVGAICFSHVIKYYVFKRLGKK